MFLECTVVAACLHVRVGVMVGLSQLRNQQVPEAAKGTKGKVGPLVAMQKMSATVLLAPHALKQSGFPLCLEVGAC